MVEDWEINVRVREVMVKRFVNIKYIAISTNNATVLVRGRLGFLGVPPDREQIPQILTRIEKDIRDIKGVRDARLSFEGWMKVGGTWKETYKGAE